MADGDVEFGHVVDLTLGEPSGTELVADAAAGATTLSVDYAGDFEDAGDLMLNGAVLTYTSIAYGTTEADPDVITLAAPLASAATRDDRVGRMAGGEQVLDWLLHVSQGDGDPADIPIPFEQRAMWSAVDVTTPVPVLVSSDLERLVEVPGRGPAFDQAAIDVPFITLYQATDNTFPDNTTQPLANWTVATEESEAFSQPGSGRVKFNEAGLFLVTLVVVWAGNSTGRRYVDLKTELAGVSSILQSNYGAPPDAANFFQQIVTVYRATVGEELWVEVRQTSGATLAVKGAASGRNTKLQIVRVQA